MRPIVTLLLVGWCVAALADDFTARLAESKAVEASAEGTAFARILEPFYGAAIRECIPPGSTDATNLGSFAFVGTLSGAGKLSNVEVRPKTRVSQCFASQLGRSQLPKPPKSPYPVHVEMRITP